MFIPPRLANPISAAACASLMASVSATVSSSEIDPLTDLSNSLKWSVPKMAISFDVSAYVPPPPPVPAAGRSPPPPPAAAARPPPHPTPPHPRRRAAAKPNLTFPCPPRLPRPRPAQRISSTGPLACLHCSMQKGAFQYWSIPDVRDPKTIYNFNFGSDIATPGSPACLNKWKQPPNGNWPSGPWQGAFQVEQSLNTCYILGGPSALGWNFSLYDATKPARGVSVTMLNGENTFCPMNRAAKPPAPQNRTFTMSLLCANMPTSTVYTSATVFELNTCDFRMEIKSIAGCPVECTGGPASSSICGGNGVCGFDTDANRAKCYCYSGFAGSGCTPSSGPSGGGLSAEGVILIVVCIVLAAVIGLVAFMFLKLRKLQVDPSAYEQMQGRFNELGMLAV